MKKAIDKERFGPWAIVTGASSGIGKEFARQLARNGLNVVLAARRLPLLEELGHELEKEFGTKYVAIEVDLGVDGFIEKIDNATRHLDVGLLISNAGTGVVGEFLSFPEADLKRIVQLHVTSYLTLTHYFGARLAARGKGGVLLTGAMGAANGVPYFANEAATKAYVVSLGKGLHSEFEKIGLNITVLLPGFTDTPSFNNLGLVKIPMRPTSVKQCVEESLLALKSNRMTIIPGRLNRIIDALVPGSLGRKMMENIIKNNKIELALPAPQSPS